MAFDPIHNHDLESDNILIASFYRFVELNRAALKPVIFEMGLERGVRGTVLLASEGINATIAGAESSVHSFLEDLSSLPELSRIEPHFSRCSFTPFRRWRVRLKKEIVTLKSLGTDPRAGTGQYVDPNDWNELIEDPNVIVVDVRNDYEVELGTFRGAINLKTEDFWEFPSFAQIAFSDRDRPIALFCTGGIRCEKASAYLVSQGYSSVAQLRGGILGYLESVSKDNSLWEGSCFVFDERIALDHGLRPATSQLYN